MRRASGAWIGAIVAMSAGGVVAFGATRLGAQRARAQAEYDEALHGVRRSAGKIGGAPPAPAVAELCVHGPEGLAVAAARAIGAPVRLSDGRLDAAALAAVSRAAFAAARDREDAIGAPALPQRMGIVEGGALAPREACGGEIAWARASVVTAAPAAAGVARSSGSSAPATKVADAKGSKSKKPSKPKPKSKPKSDSKSPH
jgi:hypothetical protein